MSARAVLRGRDIVCISSIDWDFIWQGHQQIMSMLAAAGNRVLFIENTGVRPPRLHDLPRIRHRLWRWWRSTKGFRQERENLFVFSPLVIPFPYSRVARWVNRTLLLRQIRRWMRIMEFRRPIVWTFLPTPLARDLILTLDRDLTVYYCIDDFSSSSSQARKIARTEWKVFAEADLVFVTSEKLRQHATRFAGRVHLFPFGVDYPRFESVRLHGGLAPSDLAALPRPWIGYVGGIHQWVDQGLLAEVAKRMPDASFALVGPLQTDVSRLSACPNVHLLGARSHHDVPRYLNCFDVGVVPYRLSDYTAHVYPTKLNEYLAMGLPVVATDLPEIRRFNAEHGGIVAVAEDAADFVTALRAALAKAPPADVGRRLEVARENSWDARVERMSELIEQRLRERRQFEGQAWEARLRQFYRTTRRRIVRGVAAALIVYLTLFWSPLPWMVAAPLRMAARPVPADAIVVFAGGVGETGRGGDGYQERVQAAVSLYDRGYARHLVFSTGWAFTFNEAMLMKALAVSLGVPDDAIVIEPLAGSTRDNVVFTSEILRARGWKKILLVTAPYHVRRALLTYRKLAPDIEPIPTPSKSSFYGHGWSATLPQIRAIAQEYVAIAYYRLKGWI